VTKEQLIQYFSNFYNQFDLLNISYLKIEKLRRECKKGLIDYNYVPQITPLDVEREKTDNAFLTLYVLLSGFENVSSYFNLFNSLLIEDFAEVGRIVYLVSGTFEALKEETYRNKATFEYCIANIEKLRKKKGELNYLHFQSHLIAFLFEKPYLWPFFGLDLDNFHKENLNGYLNPFQQHALLEVLIRDDDLEKKEIEIILDYIQDPWSDEKECLKEVFLSNDVLQLRNFILNRNFHITISAIRRISYLTEVAEKYKKHHLLELAIELARQKQFLELENETMLLPPDTGVQFLDTIESRLSNPTTYDVIRLKQHWFPRIFNLTFINNLINKRVNLPKHLYFSLFYLNELYHEDGLSVVAAANFYLDNPSLEENHFLLAAYIEAIIDIAKFNGRRPFGGFTNSILSAIRTVSYCLSREKREAYLSTILDAKISEEFSELVSLLNVSQNPILLPREEVREFRESRIFQIYVLLESGQLEDLKDFFHQTLEIEQAHLQELLLIQILEDEFYRPESTFSATLLGSILLGQAENYDLWRNIAQHFPRFARTLHQLSELICPNLLPPSVWLGEVFEEKLLEADLISDTALLLKLHLFPKFFRENLLELVPLLNSSPSLFAYVHFRNQADSNLLLEAEFFGDEKLIFLAILFDQIIEAENFNEVLQEAALKFSEKEIEALLQEIKILCFVLPLEERVNYLNRFLNYNHPLSQRLRNGNKKPLESYLLLEKIFSLSLDTIWFKSASPFNSNHFELLYSYLQEGNFDDFHGLLLDTVEYIFDCEPYLLGLLEDEIYRPYAIKESSLLASIIIGQNKNEQLWYCISKHFPRFSRTLYYISELLFPGVLEKLIWPTPERLKSLFSEALKAPQSEEALSLKLHLFPRVFTSDFLEALSDMEAVCFPKVFEDSLVRQGGLERIIEALSEAETYNNQHYRYLSIFLDQIILGVNQNENYRIVLERMLLNSSDQVVENLLKMISDFCLILPQAERVIYLDAILNTDNDALKEKMQFIKKGLFFIEKKGRKNFLALQKKWELSQTSFFPVVETFDCAWSIEEDVSSWYAQFKSEVHEIGLEKAENLLFEILKDELCRLESENSFLSALFLKLLTHENLWEDLSQNFPSFAKVLFEISELMLPGALSAPLPINEGDLNEILQEKFFLVSSSSAC
jgi:hypothetical protein